jgi:anthranilate synthase component 2
VTGPRVFVLDNYDSFTFNLVQYLGELGATLDVARNDKVTIDEIAQRSPDAVVISPGPGVPINAGI